MPANDQLLSEDEIHLRVAAPDFFKELIDSRTATLMQEGDLEALTAWKQSTEQKDRLFAELAPQVKLDFDQRQQNMSFDMQVVQFAAAFNRLAAEYEMPVEGRQIDSQQAARAYAQILREKWTQENQLLPSAAEPEQNIGDQEIPREDMRFVVAREIDASRKDYREATEPSLNTGPKMGQIAREEFLAEQKRIAAEAGGRTKEPPDHEH